MQPKYVPHALQNLVVWNFLSDYVYELRKNQKASFFLNTFYNDLASCKVDVVIFALCTGVIALFGLVFRWAKSLSILTGLKE